jgi:para-nitrobenzyl esterase
MPPRLHMRFFSAIRNAFPMLVGVVMQKSMLNKLVFCSLGVLLATALALPTFAQKVVSTDTGKVQGVTANGVTAFKGIPYAAPPVGKLRWREPQPAAKWSGIRSAAEFGHDCMQKPFPQDDAPLTTTPAEDCLVLNVWTPTKRAGHALPVMVWIYGGGFVNGGTSPAVYDGTPFAHDAVVFVSFNYRLGRFGFFSHPALTSESANGLLGNYGYMDQIAALRWVQRNIATFGGDPHKVTLFGESAGGASVHTLINAPQARGLFQRAIIESGGGRGNLMGEVNLHDAVGKRPSAENIGVAFAKAKGIDGEDDEALRKLRALPADTLVDGLNLATIWQQADTYPGPMTDGKIVISNPDAAYRAGTQPRIPVIVGANSSEIGFQLAKNLNKLFASFGNNAAAARLAYDPENSSDIQVVGLRAASDALMVEPARFVAATLSEHKQPAWEYRFSYIAESMRKEWKGAPHASEIPYAFDTTLARYNTKLTASDKAMAQTMHRYWVQFAKYGNPNGEGLPRWPQYSAQKDVLMNFTNNGAVAEADPWKARLDLTASLNK